METMRLRVGFGVFGIACACLAVMSVFDVTEVRAQAACTNYKTLQSALAEKMHETPSGAGLMGDKAQFAWTLFSSPKGETWTMVVIDAKGMACVVGGGQNWVDLSTPKGDPT